MSASIGTSILANRLPINAQYLTSQFNQSRPFASQTLHKNAKILHHALSLNRKSTISAGAPSSSASTSPKEGWWTKDIPSNFHHVHSVQELVDFLQAGAVADQLVVCDFFAPWCGARKAVFPKLKQICNDNPDVQFLGINFEENKALARGLGVKVLPFFHFYRGAEGRVDAFSASVSKIAKLRDAIENHKSERCFLEEQALNPLPEFPTVFAGSSSEGMSSSDESGTTPELVA